MSEFKRRDNAALNHWDKPSLRNYAMKANDYIDELEREVEVLRLYGNKDCTAMADEALQKGKKG